MADGVKRHDWRKLAILAVITLLLCFVLSEIGGLVRERQTRQQEAAAGIEQSLAGEQTLLGPLLLRHCKEVWTTPRGDVESRSFMLTAAPAQLQVSGGVSPETRTRGLFKINTYASKLTIAARWTDLTALTPRAERPAWRQRHQEASSLAARWRAEVARTHGRAPRRRADLF